MADTATVARIRATVEPIRDIRNRKTGHYRATLAHWTADGPTKEEATNKLDGLLNRASVNEYHRRYILCGDGTMLAFYWHATAGCWGYDIVGADRQHTSSCSMGNDSREKAMDYALEHAKQSYGGVVKVLA